LLLRSRKVSPCRELQRNLSESKLGVSTRKSTRPRRTANHPELYSTRRRKERSS
jgi:hypothetical protein